MASSRKPPKSSALCAHVEGVLARHVQPGDSLLVGYSGGIDSSVLLHVTHRVASSLGCPVSALYVNHGISPNAAEWARFCRATCATLGVPFESREVTLPPGSSIEARARAARYAAFAEERASFVLLAHNLDDQAETVLLQLLRGAGLKGLSAMPVARALAVTDVQARSSGAKAPVILRPLLDVPRQAIGDYARTYGVHWIEDESNASSTHDRNFLRREVLPVIASRYPGYRGTLSRTARHMSEAAALLDERAAEDAGVCAEGLPMSRLRALSGSRAKNVLRSFLAQRGVRMPPAARLEEGVRQLMHPTSGARMRIDLGTHLLARFGDELQLIRSPSPTEAADQAWAGEPTLELAHGTLEMRPALGSGVSLQRLRSAPVSVRVRRGGERLRVDAQRPRRSLKNLLREARVPPWQRDRLPLLFSGDTLVCVPGIGIDPAYRATEDESGIEPLWVTI